MRDLIEKPLVPYRSPNLDPSIRVGASEPGGSYPEPWGQSPKMESPILD